MTTNIVDRRQDPVRHKFGKDQARFLSRIREAVKKAVREKVTAGSMTDFEKGGVRVPIPKKTTEEPVIHHEQGPIFKKVFPGNLYQVGDIVPIPKGGGGGRGKEGSPDAEDGQDDFVWLPEDEFLDIFFDGRTLPDMNKLHREANTVLQRQRAGHTSRGPSHKMDRDVTNSKRKSEAVVLNKVSERRLLDNLLEQYSIYRSYKPDLPDLNLKGKNKADQLAAVTEVLQSLSAQFTFAAQGKKYKNAALSAMFNCIQLLEENLLDQVTEQQDLDRLETLRKRIPEQKKTAKDAKKFQPRHLTYHFDDEVPKPSAKAVMICKMDVSASMGEDDKNTAKAFFWILHRFLKENYDQVEVVFISHTTTAEEVDEKEFFYGDRTGGTLVSSCLEKELEVIKERYSPSEWNIYSAQASDGDNFGSDNELVAKLMSEIMPLQQASYFIEVRDPRWGISALHEVYKSLQSEFPHLYTGTVYSPGEALEAFKTFFPVGGQAPEHTAALAR